MTLRQLARGSALYAIGQMLPRVGLFILVPIYIRFMTAAEFGVMMLIVSLGSLLGILFRFGLDGALLRIHFDVESSERRDLYWTAAIIAVVGSVVVSLALLPVAVAYFSRLFAGAPFWPYGALAVGLGLTNGLQLVPAVWYRATEQPGRYLAYTAAVLAVTLIASLFLVTQTPLGPVGALLGWIAGGAVTVTVTAIVLARLGKPRVNLPLARAAAAYGLPLIPHSLSAWVLNVSDRLLIGLLIGLPAVAAQAAIGRYALGYQIAYVVSLLAMALQYALSPFLFRTAQARTGPQVYRELVTIGMSVLLALAASEIVLAPEIVTVLAPGDAFHESITVLRIAAVGTSLYALYALTVPVLLLRRRTGTLAMLTIGAAAVNVTANLLLIPRLGIAGAAVATVISYGTYSAATIVMAARSYPMRLDALRLGSLAAAAIALVLLPAAVDETAGAPLALRGLAGILFLLVATSMAVSAMRRASVHEQRAES